LAAAAPCTIFSPEDLALVSGAPKGRRDLLDDALALADPEGGRAADEFERVLRQRGALLRQAGGRLRDDVATTLDVWDERMALAGTSLAEAREALVAAIEGPVRQSYARLAGAEGKVVAGLRYTRSWAGELSEALEKSRTDDLRRGVTTVGPHRDELVLAIDGREARTHASQGEQRCVALALRLAIHGLVRDRMAREPLLLLDDVFSELDPSRSRALVAELPTGQAILTTAAPLPSGIAVATLLDIGRLAAT
jgi:DNA replication and repair protein RecF